MNRVSPSLEHGVEGRSSDSRERLDVGSSRQSGSSENIKGDISSNWDIETDGQTDKARESIELSDWDLNKPDHSEKLDEAESKSGHSLTISDHEDRGEDDGVSDNNDRTEDINNEKDSYTPELPRAKSMQESIYESPHSSRADLNEFEDSEEREIKDIVRRDSDIDKNDRLEVEIENDSHKDKGRVTFVGSENEPSSSSHSQVTPAVIGNVDETRDTNSGLQSKRVGSPFGHNRVTPVDDTKVLVSKQQNYSLSEEQQARKKSKVIGADDNTGGIGCCAWLLYTFSILLIVVTLPFSLIFCIKVVQEYERAVIFRLGRLPSGGAKGPGIFFIIPCIESYTKIDLRTVSFDVPPQEVLTKDSVTVSVDAVVYYRVSNPTVSVANVENAHHSTRLLAQTTLRNILGTKNMSEILSDREIISHAMQTTLDEATESWGIKVERVEIKDVRLPVQLQRAMAAEAEASREARAKVIAAEGEQKASHALKEAADVMAQSSAALQLRYLQTLSSISAEKNSTIIFPLPVDLIKAFMEKRK